uniref:Cwf19-like C-terminal domain-containing protein n=1 Tax=Timema tahoe TaxID=61484 RepID=A0A7R9FNX5_9NEOP|nr:unnamed protein product [Timema tahoe]
MVLKQRVKEAQAKFTASQSSKVTHLFPGDLVWVRSVTHRKFKAVSALMKQLFDVSTKSRTLQHKVDAFLLEYPNTPHTVTKVTPAEVFLGRKPHIKLSLLHSPMVLKQRVKEAQAKFTASQSSKVTHLFPGDLVWVRSVTHRKFKAVSGEIQHRVSTVSYLVIVGGRSKQISTSHLRLQDPKAVPVEFSWEMVNLVCGDVDGKFKTLFTKVENINTKSGPFDFLLCVGDFFGSSTDSWTPYKDGKLSVPIGTYVLGPSTVGHGALYPDMNGGELAPNVSYLGKRGLFTTSSGLKIAYVSGIETNSKEPPQEHTFVEADVTSVRDICYKGRPSFRGVDILVTSVWPKDIVHINVKLLTETVTKCFEESGFSMNKVTASVENVNDQQDLQNCMNETAFNNCNAEYYINIDNNVQTEPDTMYIGALVENFKESWKGEEKEEEESHIVSEEEKCSLKTYQYAVKCLKELQQFALQRNDSDMLSVISQAKVFVESQAAKRDLRQTADSWLLSWLATQIKPRYHFCASKTVYYERPPYSNFNSSGDTAVHATRFIALAKVGNEGKQKWLYAANLEPIDKMLAKELYQQTTDQTECPYSGNMLSPHINKKPEEPTQFFYDMNHSDDGDNRRKRSRKNDDGPERKQRPVFDQDGTGKAYLALAKGGLVPEHLLILPVTHHQSLSDVPEAVAKEIKKYPLKP